MSKTGTPGLRLKAGVLVGAAALSYFTLVYRPSIPAWASLVLCGLLGFVLACIGFNIMHDANHGSFSDRPRVNSWLGYSLNFMGGNSFFWKVKHNFLHHSYTNIEGLDDDIAKYPLLRQCASQRWFPAHRYQHFYLFFFYAITSLAWIYRMDFEKYFRRKVLNTEVPEMGWKEHSAFWISKGVYAWVFIAFPIMKVGFLPWLGGYLVMNLFFGSTLACVFQVGHVVEGTQFDHIRTDDKTISEEWAVHQVKGAANFARHNRMLSWFVGGLNFQIEHHLFPQVSHVHYPAISEIVRRKCEEFGLPYRCFPSLTAAFGSHWRKMKELGSDPRGQIEWGAIEEK